MGREETATVVNVGDACGGVEEEGDEAETKEGTEDDIEFGGEGVEDENALAGLKVLAL
nr:hypothetical protein [Spirulina subsalsa]